MKSNSNNQPDIIFTLLNGNYHINYCVNETINEGISTFDYNTVEIEGTPDYGKIITAIIRENYSLDAELAIMNAFAEGEKVDEYINFQNWRSMAKWIAENILNGVSITKQAFDEKQATMSNIIITMPVELLLTGGRYETLANDMLKKKVPWQLTSDGKATAYLGYILPQHLAILQSDSQVTIVM
jgi:uncharacterized protein Usg